MGENAGFLPAEVETLHSEFQKYAKNSKYDDIVERKDLKRLIADQFVEAVKTKDGQMIMHEFMKEFKSDKGLTFRNFLWLTRRWLDKRDEIDFDAEKQVLDKYAYTPEVSRVTGSSSRPTWTSQVHSLSRRWSRCYSMSPRWRTRTSMFCAGW